MKLTHTLSPLRGAGKTTLTIALSQRARYTDERQMSQNGMGVSG